MTTPVLTAPIMLSVRKVGYQVAGKWLLRDVSSELCSVKRTILLGPNGAGKSLFLRLCHGLITPNIGSLVWAGGEPPRQTMVMQRAVMLRASVKRNMRMALLTSTSKLTTAQQDSAILEALQWAEMDAYIDHPAHLLSQGLQQRLAIARAWLFRPELLFLDEPTASLDPESTYWLETMINDLAERGVKIVMSTHNLAQAHRLADDILFIDNGVLLEHQSAESFFNNPRRKQVKDYIRLESL